VEENLECCQRLVTKLSVGAAITFNVATKGSNVSVWTTLFAAKWASAAMRASSVILVPQYLRSPTGKTLVSRKIIQDTPGARSYIRGDSEDGRYSEQDGSGDSEEHGRPVSEIILCQPLYLSTKYPTYGGLEIRPAK
jgi:hypothetical protein